MDLGNIVVKFGADTSALQTGIGAAQSAIGGLAQIATGNVVGGLAQIGKTAIDVGAQAVGMAADYQSSLNKVQAYAGLTKAQTDAMSQSILAMAPALGQSPKALADGLYFVASAGFRGADALNVLKYAGMTASASNVSASVTASALVSALNGLGMSGKQAGQMSDILNATVSDGVLTWDNYGRVVGKMASAFVGTGESSAMMQKNFIEANAGLDLFTNAGVSAKLAATNLSSTINILENKTDSIAAHAAKMGLSFDESKFKTMDLQHQMEYLGQITGNNAGEMIKLMGGNSNAAKTIDFLNANTKTYGSTIDDIMSKMQNGATTQAKFAIAQSGLSAKMADLNAAVQVVMITIGSKLLPVISSIVGAITPAVSAFANLIAGSSGVSGAFGGMGSALQPVISLFQQDFIGHFLKSFDFKPLEQAFSGFGGAISGLLSPLSSLQSAMPPFSFWDGINVSMKELFTNGVAGLTSAFKGLSAFVSSTVKPAFTEISATVGGVFASHMQTASGIVASLSKWFNADLMPAVKSAMPGFQAMASVMVGTVVPGLFQLWAIGQKVVDEVMPPLVSVFEAAIPVLIQIAGIIEGGVAASLKFIMPYAVQAAAAIGQFAGEIATRVAPILVNFFKNLETSINGFMFVWKAVWPYLAPILLGVWNEIVGVVKVAWALVSGIVKIGLDLLSGNWSQAWTDVKSMLSGIWDGILQILSGGVQIMLGWVNVLTSGVVNLFTGLWNDLVGHSIIPDMVNGIIGWFMGLHTRAVAWVQNLVGDAVSWFMNLHNQAVSKIQNMVSDVVNWFLSLHNQAVQKVEDMVSGITSAIQGLLSNATSWGTDLIKNFISGIQGQMGNLTNIVGNVAGAVKNFLHFSKPDEGPLADFDTYAPDMMDMFAAGVESKIGRIKQAMGVVASAVASGINPSVALGLSPSSQSYTPQTSSYALASGNNGSNGGSQTFIVPLTIDGRQMAQVVMTYAQGHVYLQQGLRGAA